MSVLFARKLSSWDRVCALNAYAAQLQIGARLRKMRPNKRSGFKAKAIMARQKWASQVVAKTQ
jgi:hypothetical protein